MRPPTFNWMKEALEKAKIRDINKKACNLEENNTESSTLNNSCTAQPAISNSEHTNETEVHTISKSTNDGFTNTVIMKRTMVDDCQITDNDDDCVRDTKKMKINGEVSNDADDGQKSVSQTN